MRTTSRFKGRHILTYRVFESAMANLFEHRHNLQGKTRVGLRKHLNEDVSFLKLGGQGAHCYEARQVQIDVEQGAPPGTDGAAADRATAKTWAANV